VVARRFALIGAKTTCWSCRGVTDVTTIMVGERLEMSPWDDDIDATYESRNEPAVLKSIVFLDVDAAEVVASNAPRLRWSFSTTAGERYLGNRCGQCDALQGDWYLHKPEGPFFPLSQTAAKDLTIAWVERELSAIATAVESTWLDWMLSRSE